MVKSIDPFEDDNDQEESEIRLLNEGANEGIRLEQFTKGKNENDNERNK
ncbi:hypothetical protein [Paenibacillus mesotrionivorans]|uniref:Uncharacterized protein n=1 Tax=Paenibacillus mesotrionivorans TaxID=3160968 RepID=A0ACC7NWL9_9BACL